MKVEVTTYPNGLAAGWMKWEPGVVADITIMRQNMVWHHHFTRKTPAEMVRFFFNLN